MIRYRRLNENIPVVNLRNTYTSREFGGSFDIVTIDEVETEMYPLGFRFALCKVRDEDYDFYRVYAGVGLDLNRRYGIDYEVYKDLDDRSVEREANTFCDRILRRFNDAIEDFKSGRLRDIDIRRILGEFGEVTRNSELSPWG